MENDLVMPELASVDALTVVRSTGSTNTLARELYGPASANRGLRLVLADKQTGGRGRLGRPWTSGVRTSFLSSYAADVPAWLACGGMAGWLTLGAGVAVVETLRDVVHDDGHIAMKWPNDVYWDDCKLGGILTELAGIRPGDGAAASAASDTQSTVADAAGMAPADAVGSTAVVIFGIGINLFLGPENLPTPISTSLHLHVRDIPDFDTLRLRLADGIARRLRDVVRTLETDPDARSSGLLRRATELGCVAGRRVRVTLPDGTSRTGVARGIAADGGLDVGCDEGGELYVRAADVGLLPGLAGAAGTATEAPDALAGSTIRLEPCNAQAAPAEAQAAGPAGPAAGGAS